MWTALVVSIVITVFCVASNNRVLKPYDKNDSKSLQGIYALLIVACHICNYMDSGEITPPILQPFTNELRYLARFVVGGFFFISGYGIALSGGITSAKKLLSRLTKVMRPFLFFVIVYQLILAMTIGLDMYKNVACLCRGNTTYLLPNCWFVFVIIFFYVISYVLYRIRSKMVKCAVLILFSMIIIVCLVRLQFGSHWYISILALPMGFIIGSYKDIFEFYVLEHRYRCLAVCCSTLVTLYFSMVHTPLQLLSIAILPVLVTMTIKKFGLPKTAIVSYLGMISYEIYLSHGIVLYCLKCAGVSNVLLVVFYTYVGTIIISDFYNRLLTCRK